jgi:hypothetical protein
MIFFQVEEEEEPKQEKVEKRKKVGVLSLSLIETVYST